MRMSVSDSHGQSEVRMAKPPRLIVVDDEPELRKILSDYLMRHGYDVRTAASGSDLDVCLAAEAGDLLVLDIAMPHEDGLSIARRIRAQSSIPILMLTAAADIIDRVVGLEMGADDYLTKPFDMRELRARIRALLRRSEATASSRPDPTRRRPAAWADGAIGRVKLDLEARRLARDDGEEIALTSMESICSQPFCRINQPDARPTARSAHNSTRSP
jgi:DNA-binding response OmpR family regulator